MKLRIYRHRYVVVTCLLMSSLLHGQEPVNNPNIVMDLEWKIGAWQTLWRTGHFASEAVDTEVGYYVYLPPGYDDNSTQRYPVVFWLHGALGRPHEASPIMHRLDRSIRAGEMSPMIIVSCLDPTGLGMWTDSKNGLLPIETVVVEELIPHIDEHYRTLGTRAGRAIEGFSMGGYGAAYLGFKYPDKFSSVSILAGALHTPETFAQRRKAIFDNVFGGDANYAQQRSPWHWLEESADRVRGKTRVRIHVGADDGLLAWNRNFHERLDALNIDHEWGIVPNSPHDVGILMRNWEGDFFAFYRQRSSN